MPKFNRSLVITYSKIFGEMIEHSDGSFSALDKATWAKVLARLNHLAHNRKHYTPAQVLSDWFSEENNAWANKLFLKIVDSYRQLGVDPDGLVTINIWSNLTLLDRILSSKDIVEGRLDNSNSERVLFNLYLGINEEFGTKTDGIFETVNKEEHTDIVDVISRVTLTNLLPYHDLNHFKAVELLISHFVKSFYCLQFLETHHSELLKLFLKPYGVETWKEYLKAILPVASHAVSKRDDSGLNYLDLSISPDKMRSKVFLDHLSLVDVAEYTVKTDFLHARAQPLFKVDEYRYLILDEILVVNRVYNSMFFELLRLAEKNKHLHPGYKDFFSVYTYDFIEKYLCYSLLDRIFSKSQNFHISGADIKSQFNVDTEPDYYVRSGNKVFLFEIKGSVITGETKQSFSYDIIENELKEKYLFNTEDGENKAIKQLVERISILFNNRAEYDKRAKGNNLRVYPILLVSELALTTPGVNYIFNQWFLDEIKKSGFLNKHISRIHDLILLDIDTLILISKELESQRGLFEELILKYYSVVDRKKIKPKYGVEPSKEYLESLIMTAIQPFNGFIKDYIKADSPDIFMEFGEALLDDSQENEE